MPSSLRQYIAGYTVAYLWCYPIKRRVTLTGALECTIVTATGGQNILF